MELLASNRIHLTKIPRNRPLVAIEVVWNDKMNNPGSEHETYYKGASLYCGKLRLHLCIWTEVCVYFGGCVKHHVFWRSKWFCSDSLDGLSTCQSLYLGPITCLWDARGEQDLAGKLGGNSKGSHGIQSTLVGFSKSLNSGEIQDVGGSIEVKGVMIR